LQAVKYTLSQIGWRLAIVVPVGGVLLAIALAASIGSAALKSVNELCDYASQHLFLAFFK